MEDMHVDIAPQCRHEPMNVGLWAPSVDMSTFLAEEISKLSLSSVVL